MKWWVGSLQAPKSKPKLGTKKQIYVKKLPINIGALQRFFLNKIEVVRNKKFDQILKFLFFSQGIEMSIDRSKVRLHDRHDIGKGIAHLKICHINKIGNNRHRGVSL